MNAQSKYLSVAMLTMVLLAFFTAGCATTKIYPKPWNVSINKTTSASIQVDLIGVTESELSFYQGLDWDKYWPNTQVRRDAAAAGLSQVLQKGQPWIVAIDDPKWQTWLNRGDTELLVIANLPERTGLWKVALPLDRKAWNAKNNTLEIEVQETVIRVLTPTKAKK